MDNIPAWVARTGYDVDKPNKKRQVEFSVDEARKKNGRLFVTIGRVLVSTLAAKGASSNIIFKIKMDFSLKRRTDVYGTSGLISAISFSKSKWTFH